MNPWLLLLVSAGSIYAGGSMLRIIFTMIDRAHDRAAQASPREGAQHTRGTGS